jgi:hypothetical protein
LGIKLRLIKLRFGKHVPVTPEDVIPQENLGTGSTGAGTKVLYDDGTWKTPTGGSDSSDMSSAFLTMGG